MTYALQIRKSIASAVVSNEPRRAAFVRQLEQAPRSMQVVLRASVRSWNTQKSMTGTGVSHMFPPQPRQRIRVRGRALARW